MMLDLREIILLDRQSTRDLICNPNLVKKIFRSSKEMQLKSNGGSMTVKHKAKMAGYHREVWYDKKAITNILALSNVIKQYRVTYDCDDRMYVVVKHGSRQSTTLRTEPYPSFRRPSRRSTNTISPVTFASRQYMPTGNSHPSKP
jgi:uncharacterized protein YodC (DUF2158 family)